VLLYRRRSSGSGLVETAAGLILVIPVLLALLDVAALVLAQTANDTLAKKCARAAATVPETGTQAQLDTAVNEVFNEYADSSLIQKVSAATSRNPASSTAPPAGVTLPPDSVRCDVVVKCKLPVPVPFGGPSSQNFQAYAVEPIVAQPPN
jgi:Flp pilus assembly protein TadG